LAVGDEAYFMLRRKLLILWLGIGLVSPVGATDHAAPEVAPEEGAHAEDGAAVNTGAIYVPLKPAFIVNYGGPGRLKYIKADISVRLQDSATANSVRHHMPYIRNNLVLLFSAQTDESIASQDGKEALRREALEEVRNVLLQEDQQEGVIDLYFNAFLIQK
jgi:flagellar FliL protein